MFLCVCFASLFYNVMNLYERVLLLIWYGLVWICVSVKLLRYVYCMVVPFIVVCVKYGCVAVLCVNACVSKLVWTYSFNSEWSFYVYAFMNGFVLSMGYMNLIVIVVCLCVYMFNASALCVNAHVFIDFVFLYSVKCDVGWLCSCMLYLFINFCLMLFLICLRCACFVDIYV